MTTQDIDKLSKLALALKGLVSVGEEVMKDGKIDLADIAVLPKMAKVVEELVGAVKDFKELGEEAGDIDAVEAIRLVQILLS